MTKSGTFALQSAIIVGTVTIHPAGTVITVRKPGAGEFRNVSLGPLTQGDYASLETLAPRITSPRLEKAEIEVLDPADLMQLHLEVLDFLLPSTAKQAASLH